jgi:hypothetical protein
MKKVLLFLLVSVLAFAAFTDAQVQAAEKPNIVYKNVGGAL